MGKEDMSLLVILGVGLIISLCYIGYSAINPNTITIQNNVTVEQPLVLYALSDWADNADKPTESLFRGYVYNFGEVEVRDIELTCRTYDGDKVLDSYTENIGNLGSLSNKYIEISHNLVQTEDVEGNCYVTSMSSGINLFKRMPDYAKYYD